MSSKVIVFVKNTVLGRVKTRLAKTMGDDKALKVYNLLLGLTKEQVSKLTIDKEVSYAWQVEENDLWNNDIFKKSVQVDGDLGEKMKHSFKAAFKDGYQKVVLIGSDCPTLTSEILDQAFLYLNSNDAVFGPSKDGGYYLIGMSKFNPTLFDGIKWSTSQVLSQTEEIAKNESISYAKLPVLNDIDDENDWNDYLKSGS